MTILPVPPFIVATAVAFRKLLKKRCFKILTHILRNQNLASWRKTFSGFMRKATIIITSANGFTNGGILKLALYIKLNMLRAQITPKMAASSIKCCSERWFRGSNSNISTWLTPEDRHPYTFIPMRNMNSTNRNGPLYSLKADLKFSVPPSWNSTETKLNKISSQIAAFFAQVG